MIAVPLWFDVALSITERLKLTQKQKLTNITLFFQLLDELMNSQNQRKKEIENEKNVSMKK